MAIDVLGAPVKRVEDPRFITGNGRYLDDIKLPVRWPTWPSCAARTRTPTSARSTRPRAKAMPGVIAVITGADIPYNPLPMAWPAGGVVGHPEQRQHAARAGHRQRQVDRRGRRRGHRRDARAGDRRARRDRRRLGAAAGRRRRGEGDPARRAAAPRERPEQRRLRVEGRRQGRHRRRHRRAPRSSSASGSSTSG